MLAEASSIGFVSLLITCCRQKNKYQLKQLICTSINHAASVPAEWISNTSTAGSRNVSGNGRIQRIEMTKNTYQKNKPLINSILTGLLYFGFCWSLDFGDATKMQFMTLMLFLPGLTFPLTTCYYRTETNTYTNLQRIAHLILSVGIYHGSVWLFSGEGRIKYITVLAGLTGSLFFLLATKYILKKSIPFTHIVLTSILSGLSFFLLEVTGRQGIIMGMSVFLWTVINGLVINAEYRKATYR